MKKLPIILGSIVALLVIVGAGTYFVFFNAPSAEAVCAKTLELAKKEISKTGVDVSKMSEKELMGQSVADCAKSSETFNTKSAMETAKERKCVMAANSIDEATKC
jgi:hypothetical protein